MNKTNPHSHPLDHLIEQLDQGLRTLFASSSKFRPYPANSLKESDPIADDPTAKAHSASLMRVNHVGEVCAQALYQGQALTARSQDVKLKMQEAANEEIDHLNWCKQRLTELNSHTSYLNPAWYLGALGIGITAGIAGDKWSLGFLAETEQQVVKHLEGHLGKLPEQDTYSRAIVKQMREDEAKHAEMAKQEGAAELPNSIKKLMGFSAKIMTTVAAKI